MHGPSVTSPGVALRHAATARLARAIPRWHRRLWRISGGRLGTHLHGVEFCLLSTTGRRTGRRRATPLVLVRADAKLVLIASNGGSDQHPVWFLNLLHEPLVSVETRDGQIKARARLAGHGERDELWPQIDAAYSGYRNYRKKTTREIPVIILDPVP